MGCTIPCELPKPSGKSEGSTVGQSCNPHYRSALWLAKGAALSFVLVAVTSCFPVIGKGYYSPSAKSGSLGKYPYGSNCPSPKEVLIFRVQGAPNVSVRIWAERDLTEQDKEAASNTKIYIDLTYFESKSEYVEEHTFRATSSSIEVKSGNRTWSFPSAFAVDAETVHSPYGVSTLAILTLPLATLDSFYLSPLTFIIDGKKVHIPQVMFHHKQMSYISPVNC